MYTQHNTTKSSAIQTDDASEYPQGYGVYYDETINEYRVIVGGETVNFATWWSTAVYQFKEACRVRRAHLKNNPMEAI